MKTVAIVGAGLIGGSFGLALRKAGFRGKLIGVSSPAAIQDALACGAIDEARPLGAAVNEADLVYLARTIGRIIETIPLLKPHLRPGALVTDAGSTKSAIVDCARLHLPGQFLGGHPMAGKEKRGAAAAEADLFAGRVYALTPASPEDLKTPVALELQRWIEAIGARLVTLAPAEHDRIVAHTSHLPQLASTALAAALARRLGSAQELQVSGPGLADTTRLAGSSYELWGDILQTNTAAVEAALGAYIAELESLRGQITSARMRREFETANEFVRRLAARGE